MDLLEEMASIDEGLALVMMQIRKSVRSAMREAAQTEELSHNEIEVLLFLAHKKCDTAREITQIRGISRSLVSKSVDLLLKKGYIDAKQDERDRRVIHLLLLPKAEKNVEKLNEARKEFLLRLCEGITREEAEAFMAIVQKMSVNVQKYLPESGRQIGKDGVDRR